MAIKGTGVIVIKDGNTKEKRKKMIEHTGYLMVECWKENIKVIHFLTVSDVKDMYKQVFELYDEKAFNYVIILTPQQFIYSESDRADLISFCKEIKHKYNVSVKWP